MKDHPLTPMRDSNLMRLLAPQVSAKTGLADRFTVAQGARALREKLESLAAEDVAHVVIDAVADEDLNVIARACHQMPLMTGGSAIAMPLPALYLESGALSAEQVEVVWPHTPKQGVVLSGSCSAMTRAQVETYLELAPGFKLDPLALEKGGLDTAIEWLSGQALESMPMIYATAEPTEVALAQEKLGVEKAGAVIEQALSAIAVAVRDRGGRRFVVAGGETSGAVTKALGITQLDVGAEIAPGVPWTYCESNGHQIALTLKSGNFGDRSFFSRAIELLETA